MIGEDRPCWAEKASEEPGRPTLRMDSHSGKNVASNGDDAGLVYKVSKGGLAGRQRLSICRSEPFVLLEQLMMVFWG